MPIIKWEPFSELDRFFDERPYISMFPKLGWDLAIDLYEEGGNVVAKMNLPGVKPEELLPALVHRCIRQFNTDPDFRESILAMARELREKEPEA